jgi:hypothetical protein
MLILEQYYHLIQANPIRVFKLCLYCSDLKLQASGHESPSFIHCSLWGRVMGNSLGWSYKIIEALSKRWMNNVEQIFAIDNYHVAAEAISNSTA